MKGVKSLMSTMYLWKSGLEPAAYLRYHEAHTNLYTICARYVEMVNSVGTTTIPKCDRHENPFSNKGHKATNYISNKGHKTTNSISDKGHKATNPISDKGHKATNTISDNKVHKATNPIRDKAHKATNPLSDKGHKCTDELSLFYENRHKTSLANIFMCLRVYFHECIC